MSQRQTIRYSSAFKLKVIGEIEKGVLSVEQARRVYGIGGGSTIQKWLRAYGKSHMLSQVIRVQMKNELDQLKVLEARNRELEHALSNAQLELLRLRSTMEIMEEDYGIDFKKKSVIKASLEAVQRKQATASKRSAESTE